MVLLKDFMEGFFFLLSLSPLILNLLTPYASTIDFFFLNSISEEEVFGFYFLKASAIHPSHSLRYLFILLFGGYYLSFGLSFLLPWVNSFFRISKESTLI